MDTISRIVGILHLIFAISISVYAFVMKKSGLDKYYILYNYLVFLSWTFFDRECYVTYVIKKMKDPHYVAGSESTDLTDMNFHFDKDKFRAFLDIFVALNIVSIFLVNRRNGYLPTSLNVLLVITYFIYSLFLRKFMDKSFYFKNGLNKVFRWFQLFMRFFVAYLLFLLLSKWNK